jgi:colicin import membrane protein
VKAAKEAAAAAAQEKKRLAEEERQRKVAEAKAAKEAAAAAAQEKKRLAEEERQRKVAEAKAAKEAAAAAAQEKRRLVEERRRKVAEEKAAKEAAAAHERKLLADKDLQGSHLAQAAAKAVVRIASQEVGAAANAQRESRRSNPAPDRERGSIESIGFRQVPEGTRVFVRTTTAVPFAVHGEPERVILELHARIGHRNNRRMLDTRFFDSPVAFVAPEVVGDAVRIAIKLKEQVPYAARREGNEIVVEFQRR